MNISIKRSRAEQSTFCIVRVLTESFQQRLSTYNYGDRYLLLLLAADGAVDCKSSSERLQSNNN